MVTSRQVGAGVGAAGVGVIAAEGVQQGAEREVYSQRAADLGAIGVSGVPVSLAALGQLGVIDLNASSTVGLAGFGTGTALWYAGRRTDVAPRIVLGFPDEVSLTRPFASLVVFSLVGAGVATIVGTAR